MCGGCSRAEEEEGGGGGVLCHGGLSGRGQL